MKKPSHTLFDPSARKRSANLSVNSSLLEKARELRINLSKTLEEALVSRLAQHQRERWLEENKGALDAYNRRVSTHGSFGDHHRRF